MSGKPFYGWVIVGVVFLLTFIYQIQYSGEEYWISINREYFFLYPVQLAVWVVGIIAGILLKSPPENTIKNLIKKCSHLLL